MRSYGEIEWRPSLVLMLMVMSLTVMQWHRMLSKKVTASINGVLLFHRRVSKMFDGVV